MRYLRERQTYTLWMKKEVAAKSAATSFCDSRVLLPMMPSAVVPTISPVLAESRFAGTVAITVFMVISAVFIAVVSVPSVFGATVHRAGRTAVSVIITTIVSMPPVFGASIYRTGRAVRFCSR